MNEHQRRHEVRAEALLLVVVVIWGANYPLAKWGIGGLNVFVFNSIRFVVASLVLGLLFAFRSSWRPLPSGDLPKIIGLGLIANVLYQVIFILGLSMTTAGNSAVLLATSPLWTAFFNAWIHKEKIQRTMWGGMIISLVGIILVVLGSGKRLDIGGTALLGDIIILGAAITWGLNNNLQKPLVDRNSVLQVTMVMMVVGGVGLSLVGLPAMVQLEWGSIHWTYYAAATLSGAISIGISTAIWSNGVKRLGPSRTAIFSNLIPVLAVILSAIFLQEEISITQVGGIFITMAGVWLARR